MNKNLISKECIQHMKHSEGGFEICELSLISAINDKVIREEVGSMCDMARAFSKFVNYPVPVLSVIM